MQNIALQSTMPRFSGKYRITKLRAKPRWMPTALWLKLYHAGLINFMVISQTPYIHNRIMLSLNYGVNLFIRHLGGDDTYPLELNFAAIGTGSTAPVDGNTGLETPVLSNIPRATVDFTAVDILTTEWFMTNDELANGTYNEFGLFCNTQIFCRSIISPAHTKASNEDTLVEYIINAGNEYTP